jgi:Cd2+/Zn2+-exporting ATPase
MARTQTTTDKITTEKLRLSGMDCADCAQSIEKSLQQMPGVASANVSFATSTADVKYDPTRVERGDMVKRIEDLGYSVEAPAAVPSRNGSLEFSIEGMDCADCARTIEKAVAGVRGVSSATVNFNTARLSVSAGSDVKSAVERVVEQAGYRAMPANTRETSTVPFWRRERRVITTGIGTLLALAGFVLSLFSAPALIIDALFAATLVVSGFGFARAGLLAARAGRADMNLLMTVAAIGAAAIGDWGEAATVVLLFAFGGTLQSYTLDKTRRSIRSLMDLSPTMALVRRADSSKGLPVMHEIRVPVEEVQPGETVIVGPGERVPLDGVLISGSSSVDQSPITGESVPVDVAEGSEVYAGTINGPGVFNIRTLRASNDTTLAHIIEIVEEAQAQRAPSQQFVDRFAAIYTPVVIAGAVLVAVVPPLLLAQPFIDWFYRALVLLVIACPCALVISTPVSIVAAIGAATRNGVLIKGGATLEALGRVRSVAFDKTGTLTRGRPQVSTIYALDGDPEALLALAASVEVRSEHPLARAVVHRSRSSSSPKLEEARDFTALPGRGAKAIAGGRTVYVGNSRLFDELGVSLEPVATTLESIYGQGGTAAIVGTESSVLGVIGLSDRPREESRGAISDLKEAGIKTVAMLTGDNERTAAAIARETGVSRYFADLLPADKVGAVKALEREGNGPVAMVGDGVNDAPALASAEVGIAMGTTGTDAALEVADVALMSDDLSRLAYVVCLSRKTLGVIKQNITVSLAIKVLALALAAFGSLPLWGAILADMGVSLLVTLNGMRLLGFKVRSRQLSVVSRQ